MLKDRSKNEISTSANTLPTSESIQVYPSEIFLLHINSLVVTKTRRRFPYQNITLAKVTCSIFVMEVNEA
jgi:hypothetical protein